MLTEQRLHDLLSTLPEVVQVIVAREGSELIAGVVSTAFEGREEHERQADVWGLLLKELSDAEQAQIGFVYTNTPKEKAEAEREAAAAGE